ncbi:hypothetical protein ColTof3_01521 [Colletotrichum tofieldiae]|nr:hypothetical protein ColTof3_01521 [Colletotrichum tofieldiae]
MPKFEARASSNINPQSQDNHGSLFVEQVNPARGSSLLNHSAACLPASSSPSRIPSSPCDNHIGNLRVAARLESRTYRTGFFPETEPSNARDSFISEDEVLEKALVGTQVSGFILEDDNSDSSPQEIKKAPEARASGKHLKRPNWKQAESMKKGASGDDVGASNVRPSQLFSTSVERDYITLPQGTTSQHRRSQKSSANKTQAEEKLQAQDSKMRQTSNAARGGVQGNALATAKKSSGASSFNLMSNMAIRASKPSIRVVAVPKQTSLPGSRNPRQDARTSKI